MNKIIILLLPFLFCHSEGLKCHVCSMTATDPVNDLCYTSPTSLPGSSSFECNLRYCTIIRQENKNAPGIVASFHRACENNPVHLNTMIDSAEHRTYYRACTLDLCNTGNGIQPVTSSKGPSSSIITLLVPGTGESSTHCVLPQLSTIILAILFSLTLYIRQ